MFFDTHTHLNVDKFKGEEAELIEEARKQNVKKMAIVGFDTPTIEKALQLSRDHEGVYSIVGWHPTDSETYTDQVEEKLIEQLQLPKVVAMGEMGLDYYWDTASKKSQHEAFKRQIKVAKELNLPISIHNRDATEDTYNILKEAQIQDIGGIMHSFNVDTYWMEKFLDLGMHISLSGVVTFKNAPEVKEVAQAVPFDRLLIETDAPYLTPMPHRGKRNEPSYVRFVAEEIARLRDCSIEEVATQTTKNADKLFRLT
ncbi:TatD family hydrolase [Marinilactibacillus sp. XAAS-LB27]|uniref:TatD family hydrolase n=1 Tax=Marinilactibacillus sp. XAAS-LB27 TaxID=3114538 RepID=UPI002E185F7A|nr:TatD family hydrolase [Marinilactibacillus sp. XAAS-LB27]